MKHVGQITCARMVAPEKAATTPMQMKMTFIEDLFSRIIQLNFEKDMWSGY